VLGDLVDAEVGHIRDDHSELGCSCHIDVVEADAVASDDLAVRRRLEDFSGTRLPVHHDRVGVSGKVDKLGDITGLGGHHLGSRLGKDLRLDIETLPRVIRNQNLHSD